jgi:GNAT superfamily N-acetyltransferase
VSGELRIGTVDPYDEEALRAWYELYRLAERHDRPYVSVYMYEEIRAAAQAPAVGSELVHLLGSVDGVPVSGADVELPLMDNRGLAEVGLRTHPEHRRRGYAGTMLAHVEALLVQRGRSLVTVYADCAYESGPTGAGDPGVEFLRHRGYSIALCDVQRAVDLPIPEERLTGLLEEAAPHHVGYTLRQFGDRCPDELLESYGRLVGTLITEAPSGELTLEEEVFDARRLRHEEDVTMAAGRTRVVTVALDPAGEVVAYTDIRVPRHEPGRAYQWGTLVHPAHRGHRLGTAVKAANHLLLQRQEPSVTQVITENAEVNDHMVAVNDRLGFRPTARCVELHKAL